MRVLMKRKPAQRLLFILVIIFFTSCTKEVYNISWNGVVADKKTGDPVSDASVMVTSTYQQNIDETTELSKSARSDQQGRFNIAFPRGFGLTVKTSAPGFLSGLEYKVVKRSTLHDTIYISPHPFNASLVVRLSDSESFSPSVPFIRESQISGKNKNGKSETLKWGFDFLTGHNTTNLDSADIWVDINKNSNRVVLNASAGGGIFPVYDESENGFITRITKAPESGYVKSHVVTGDEAGFFILCRNGTHVAKMIPDSRICVLSYKQGDGNQVKETGIRFDYLFQPDLKNRLYFPVSASAEGTKYFFKEYPEGYDHSLE